MLKMVLKIGTCYMLHSRVLKILLASVLSARSLAEVGDYPMFSLRVASSAKRRYLLPRQFRVFVTWRIGFISGATDRLLRFSFGSTRGVRATPAERCNNCTDDLGHLLAAEKARKKVRATLRANSWLDPKGDEQTFPAAARNRRSAGGP
jgi:hypothetical protein